MCFAYACNAIDDRKIRQVKKGKVETLFWG